MLDLCREVAKEILLTPNPVLGVISLWLSEKPLLLSNFALIFFPSSVHGAHFHSVVYPSSAGLPTHAIL